jgi:hypothetical protein
LIPFAVVALIALPAAAHAATVTIQTDPSGRVTSQPAGLVVREAATSQVLGRREMPDTESRLGPRVQPSKRTAV